MKKNPGSAALLAGTAVVFAITAPAAGQELPGGMSVGYGLTSELRINDNLDLAKKSPGITTLWDNRLTLGIASETPVSQLRFNIGGTLRASVLPGQSLDATFDEPFAEMTYAWEGANSRFEAGASWNKVDLSFADPLSLIQDGTLSDTDLIADRGRRITSNARALFETGLNDPFGVGAEVEYDRLQYANTTDPGLYDSRTTAASVFTRYRFSPVAEGRVTASWEKYDARDTVRTNRETLGLTAGLSYEIDPITTLEASLGYDRITETTNLPSTTTRRGFKGSVSLTRDMRNGTAGLVFESDLTANGRRSTLTASRALELPRGSLDASLGASYGPSGNFVPVGSLAYTYALPRGTITASLDQRVATNTSGNDVTTTGASLGYKAEINRVSSLAFEADFAAVADLGASPVDLTTLTGLRATYTHELTEVWDISAGYEHRIRTQTGMKRRSSNEIFVLLEHKFDARP